MTRDSKTSLAGVRIKDDVGAPITETNPFEVKDRDTFTKEPLQGQIVEELLSDILKEIKRTNFYLDQITDGGLVDVY